MPRTIHISGPAGPIECGEGRPLVVIAGPCALESRDMALHVANTLRDACAHHGLPYIFKASFDKANRTSAGSPRGPGLARGLDDLAHIRESLGVPVTTDIHLPDHADPVAEVVDVLQIPAFLCRQSDLLEAAGAAAARHGRVVNVKKGQFLSPREMQGPVGKLLGAGSRGVIVTERGTFFGYHRLVTDFIGIGDLLDARYPGGEFVPVCFDATHSTQLPGLAAQTGGRPEHGPLLARAAVAAGVHALFLEAHPDPPSAISDAATQLTLDTAVRVIGECRAIRAALDAAAADMHSAAR